MFFGCTYVMKERSVMKMYMKEWTVKMVYMKEWSVIREYEMKERSVTICMKMYMKEGVL